MEALVDLIVGSSTTLDVYVVIRLVIFCLILELFTVACGLLAGLKK